MTRGFCYRDENCSAATEMKIVLAEKEKTELVFLDRGDLISHERGRNAGVERNFQSMESSPLTKKSS